VVDELERARLARRERSRRDRRAVEIAITRGTTARAGRQGLVVELLNDWSAFLGGEIGALIGLMQPAGHPQAAGSPTAAPSLTDLQPAQRKPARRADMTARPSFPVVARAHRRRCSGSGCC
jgi:hypothetical protein